MAVLAVALCARAAAAHDFWIEPESFRPAVGERVPLRLLVGEHFKGEPVLYAPAQFARYVSVDDAGEHAVPGTLGDDPAGAVKIERPGRHVVGYYGEEQEITFDSFGKFEQYLKTEGLERHRVVAEKRFKLRQGIVERYRRCAKSLVAAGGRADPADRTLGLPLELIAETDPYDKKQKQLRVRLLYRDKPLAGALVVAFKKERPQEKQRIRSDADGRATFDLDRPGTWLVTSVHMIPASLFSRADWYSLWASLTFERP